jgi:hypothetical protein
VEYRMRISSCRFPDDETPIAAGRLGNGVVVFFVFFGDVNA